MNYGDFHLWVKDSDVKTTHYITQQIRWWYNPFCMLYLFKVEVRWLPLTRCNGFITANLPVNHWLTSIIIKPFSRRVHRIMKVSNIHISIFSPSISCYLQHHKNALLLEVLALSYILMLAQFLLSMTHTVWAMKLLPYISYAAYNMPNIISYNLYIYRTV